MDDEFEAGRKLRGMFAYAAQFEREPIPVSELVVGMKCGGSDGLSGITANPTVGRFSDMMAARGGSTVLTEVPEMFGAEGFLMNRCVNKEVFDKAVNMINGFKNYFISHHEVVYDNPSPGKQAGRYHHPWRINPADVSRRAVQPRSWTLSATVILLSQRDLICFTDRAMIWYLQQP